MKQFISIAVLAATATLAGCATTEEASTAARSRWVGQSADSFFSQFGPPASQYTMANGDTLYTWRGGETVRQTPARYAAPTAPSPIAGGWSGGTGPAFRPSAIGASGFGQGGMASAPSTPLYGRQTVQTSSMTDNSQPGVTRTTTTTTTSGGGINLTLPSQNAGHGRMLSPGRTETLFCELQITADAERVIRALRISKDTAGAGVSLSRCAEVLGV